MTEIEVHDSGGLRAKAVLTLPAKCHLLILLWTVICMHACMLEVIAVTPYIVIKWCAGPQGDNELLLVVEEQLQKLWIP